MPIDRNNTNTSRPLKPSLATTRTAKTPVAPRLAPSLASASASSKSNPRVAGTSTPRANVAIPDDVTPTKPFINNNVTPRSSARKSRASVTSPGSIPSAEGTPAATPSSSRPVSGIDFGQKELGNGYNGGLGMNRPSSAQSKRPKSVVVGGHYNTPTPRPPLANAYGHAASESSMFFHANNARPQPELPPPQKKAVFFHANGEQDENPKPYDITSPPLSSVGKSQSGSRFFHADSISEMRGTPQPIVPPSPLSISPEPGSNLDLTQAPPSLQPPSPSKETMHLSYRKGVSQILRPSLHRGNTALSILSGPNSPDAGVDGSKRRSSVASSAVRHGHAKSPSLSSIDSPNSLKKVLSSEQPSIVPSPLHNERRMVSDNSLNDNTASAPLEPIESFFGPLSPNAMNGTGPAPGESMLEHMNKLAANARRERKVLDLEISNSSLLAINRSLEKEVRKQKSEIRRFRRMTRAGRFATDANSNLEEFSAIGMHELGNLSDMPEEDDNNEPEENDDAEDSSDSSLDESMMTVPALAERDAAHRVRDEKRLQLDISKHQEILNDSQKMNQSLGRCLTRTEQLIKDAQKALEYQVKLGGRVLSSEELYDDDEEEEEESKGLLSPWTPHHRTPDLDFDPLSMIESKERDSGVDLDGMQALLMAVPGDTSSLGSSMGDVPSHSRPITPS